MNQRRRLSIYVEYYFDWDFVGIAQIRRDLNELEQMGAEFVNIVTDDDDGFISTDFKALYKRLETDKELSDRINARTKLEDSIEKEERLELARLTEKYKK